MTVQRAVVSGVMADLVQTRSMFTCNVEESGGDTFEILWDAYLQAIYDAVEPILSTTYTTSSYEIQNLTGQKWIPSDTIAFANTGGNMGDPLPNAVSLVLLGKANGLRAVGRKFFSGLTDNTAVGNYLLGSMLTTAAVLLAAYVTPFTGIGGGVITPGIVDKTFAFKPFVGGTVSSVLGSMRKRKPGVGI